jgi:hypothetical protein
MLERVWLQRITVLAVVAVAFVLRLVLLDGPSLRGDEALSVNYGQMSPSEIIRITRYLSGHPPLYYLLMHAWVRLAGTSEFAARFLTVWWGVLLLPAIFVLGRELHSPWAGLGAAFLAAINSYYVWHAQDARSYALLGTVAVLACLAFWRALQRPVWTNWVLYAVAGLAVVHCHYFGAFLVLAHGIYLAVVLWREERPRRRALSWGAALSWAGMAVSLLPWLWLARTVVTGGHGSGGPPLSLWTVFRQSLVTFGAGYWHESWGEGLLTVGLILLFFWGMWSAYRRAPRAAGFVTLLALVPLVCFFVLVRQGRIYRERYLIYSAPALTLLSGIGLASLGAWWPPGRGKPYATWAARLGLVLALLFLVSGNLFALQRHYLSPEYAKSPQWREAMSFVQERLAPSDVVVLNHLDQAALYYYGGELTVLPSPDARDSNSVQAALHDLVERYDRVWLLPDTVGLWDREGLVREWLDEHAEAVLERVWRGILLVRYHTPRYLAREYVALDARLETESGAEIVLLGYTLRDEEGRAVERLEVEPGGQVRLSLYWRTESAVENEYVVFCHLLDGTGWLRGQQDNPPREGTYPTKVWTSGETVVDVYRVPLAPDAPLGDALIEIGMYDPVDGERLPVYGQDVDSDNRRVLLHNVLSIQQMGH